jgi:hypothetical protein
MKRFLKSLDALIIGGWVSSLFTGITYPNYLKLIVSNLDVQVIAVGSFLASFFPLVSGMFFEKPNFYKKLYSLLPLVMYFEIGFTIFSIFVSSMNMVAYYVMTMVILGLFTSTVMYLLQGVKEKKYARNRATFERRYAMADSFGYLVGSMLVFCNVIKIERVFIVLFLGLLQTVIVYLLFLCSYNQVEKVQRAWLPSINSFFVPKAEESAIKKLEEDMGQLYLVSGK